MKKFAYTLSVAVIVFIATALSSLAQSTENRQVAGFNRIASAGPFTVHVKIDGTESLKISNKPDVIKFIETVVEDGTLKIKFKDDLENGQGESDRPIDIYITAKSLSCLANTGSGSIDVDGNVTGNDVSIVLNGAGSIKSSVKSGNLQVIMSGAGRTNLSGTVDKAKVLINGAGEMNGRDLKTKDAAVTISGSANVYFSADNTVSANIIGSGSVYYSGTATIASSNVIGAGGVSKAN
ncbi:MAG TPA: head GIN domain-containing protein [Mucilaginibacter sp.]|jgi:hypothetical protein|nr:head GIN domain-containing protein [Mucilaginibacter sp.]